MQKVTVKVTVGMVFEDGVPHMTTGFIASLFRDALSELIRLFPSSGGSMNIVVTCDSCRAGGPDAICLPSEPKDIAEGVIEDAQEQARRKRAGGA